MNFKPRLSHGLIVDATDYTCTQYQNSGDTDFPTYHSFRLIGLTTFGFVLPLHLSRRRQGATVNRSPFVVFPLYGTEVTALWNEPFPTLVDSTKRQPRRLEI
ncbi:uncharacterized protein CLUP02_09744 [Colletotrichum lupini]|uniref:Uncharacterized protein n=1 Tax=Colletotrichum lupini TaxID=145971 RepID=A0A9Q8WHW4_9PEZI|nr:uncharacterized protein CLUP02_09744 [Colletotrichum lupini]UQC84248.1 hypothetical protein CLUP02_09744 [Colletotrichum lupini]